MLQVVLLVLRDEGALVAQFDELGEVALKVLGVPDYVGVEGQNLTLYDVRLAVAPLVAEVNGIAVLELQSL